jgi:glucosamine 6-phosphate synthetase-like amidotransferase/phosphosugar isomerase protein
MLHMNFLVDKKSLVIAVSRSGERGWVVEALKKSIDRGAFGIAITGSKDNLLSQSAQITLETSEGPEITYTKTKSVTCCTGLLMRIALELEEVSNKARLKELLETPGKLRMLAEAVEPQVAALIPGLLDQESVMIGGTGSNHGVALETALILQEAGNVPSTGMDTGNLLHGPWGSSIRNWLSVLLVSPPDLELSKKTLELAGNLGWKRLCVAGHNIDLKSYGEYSISMPVDLNPCFWSLAYLTCMQLLTYYWCIGKGLNPDAPTGMEHMLNAIVPAGRQEPEFRK